jgi:LysR family transcriptional regulator for metE and metH
MQQSVLEVRHLRLVAAIVDHGSLTRASERLNLTQSALSHQLIELEQRLGTPLFHRVNKRMTATEAGERVLATARRMLAELEETERELHLFATERRGTIRLTTQCYTVYHWLPTVMKTFEQKYPGVDIRIEVDATETPFEALLEGKLDVAFVTADKADRAIELEPLFQDEMKVIVAPDHPFASKPWVTASDIAGETLLTYSDLRGNVISDRLLRPAGLEPKKHLQVRLTEAIIELVKANMGIAVLAQWAAAPYVASGSVAAVPITRRGFSREWKAAYVRARPMPAYVRSFVDMVAKEGPRALRMALTLAVPANARRR